MGSDVAVLDPAVLQELQAAQDAEIDESFIQSPILKIGEALTREVSQGDAEAGDFINTLTSESLGNKLDFIVGFYQAGRFAADRESGRAFTAFSKEIPDAWSDLVGEQFVGTLFSEYPDAEEQYKKRVNSGELKWGKGPLISTTHNFTGLAIVEPLEGEGDADLQPVRLSLKRINVPSARKWLTLIRSRRNAAYWDYVYNLSTTRKDFNQGVAHVLNVGLGRKTTPEERQVAVELASAVAQGRVQDNAADAEADDKVAPDAEGGADL